MVLIGKAVRIGKMCALTTQLSRLLIHQIDKIIDAALADVIGKHQRRIVARGYHQTVEQVFDREALADMALKPHDRALGIQRRKRGRGDLHTGVLEIGNVLGNHDIGHYLGRRSRIHSLVGVLLKHHDTGIEILEIHGVGSGIDITAVIDRTGGYRQSKYQYCTKQKRK